MTVPGGPARSTVLDGGLATELEAHGHDLSDRLWSARLLLTDPAAIEAVHLAYFRAGAQVATTASYQASIEGFAAAGLERAEALRLIALSVAARAAGEGALSRGGRRRPPRSSWPARSVRTARCSPTAPSTAATTTRAPSRWRDFHRPRIEALVEAGADLLAFETIPTIREAEVLVGLLDDVAIPAWLSYSCRDGGSTSAGEPIEAAVAVGAHPRIVAVGVNCTAPRHLPALLAAARAATDLPLIAYPNGGDRWDAASRRWVADDGGAYDPAAVASWAALGATWLGGCCGTGPADIAALAARVRAA